VRALNSEATLTRALVIALLALSATASAATPTDDAHWILNGDDPTVEQFQNTGALIADLTVNMFGQTQSLRLVLCSSTLIAPDTVLLAAHCIDDNAITQGMGTVTTKKYYWSRQADLSYMEGPPSTPLPADAITAKDWIGNESFDVFTMNVGLSDNHDIALVFLDTPVLDVAPALLPTLEEAPQIVADSLVDVVGWGQQTATSGQQQPPPGTVGIKKWGQRFISGLSAYEMKVGEVQSDVRKCHGDSGGPTFMTITTGSIDPVRVIGVTSHAYDETDCSRTGGVDTRVDYHLAWIEAQMTSRCTAGTRVWCDVPGIPQAAYPEERGGCGCSSSEAPASSLLAALLAPLMLLRRRRA